MTDIETVEEAVREVFAERFGSTARVVDVIVSEGTNSEGETIFRIEVVFDTEGERLEGRKAVGFIRHLVTRLEQSGTDAFPVTSFVSKSDFEGRAA